jgi:hypothetical protein
MGREKDRKLRRRKRRKAKLHNLKTRLTQTEDLKERRYLIRKINKINVYPSPDMPKK